MFIELSNQAELHADPMNDYVQSFYNKAYVEQKDDGLKILYSYGTAVAAIDTQGRFHRLWNKYSQTTMRHVNSFSDMCGLGRHNKKWWESLPIESLANI